MLKVIAASINPETVQTIRTSPNHGMTRTAIHTCARVAQMVFASGCFFAALQIPYRILQILMGGFIFIQGPQMILQAFPIIFYYDLAKVSSNIASIFKSTVIIQFAKDRTDGIPYGKQIAQVMTDCEEGFTLPKPVLKNIKDAETLTEALTYETIVAHNLNSVITQFLKR